MAALSTHRSLLIRLRDAARSSNAFDDHHAAAWREFVRIYAPEVLRWCRGCGLQETDAADVCQDVLVRFWKQAASFEYDPSRRFRGYLRQILKSALAGWSAARGSDRPAASSGAKGLLESLPAREALLERIEAAYDTELLTLAMKDVRPRVKPHTWRAFELLAIERRSGSEAAEELAISTDLVYAARRNVQKMLKEAIVRLEGGTRT